MDVPAGGVVVVSGALLLGAGLDFDLTVHLTQTPAALARQTDPGLASTTRICLVEGGLPS